MKFNLKKRMKENFNFELNKLIKEQYLITIEKFIKDIALIYQLPKNYLFGKNNENSKIQ